MDLYLLSPSLARPTLMNVDKVEFLPIGQSKKVPIIGENGTFRVYKTTVNSVLVKSPHVLDPGHRCLLLIRGALQGNLNEALQQGVVVERELNGVYGAYKHPSEALLAIYSPGALLVYKGRYYLWTGTQWHVSEIVEWPKNQHEWSIYLAEQNIGGQFL